jgi:hypothetical protein
MKSMTYLAKFKYKFAKFIHIYVKKVGSGTVIPNPTRP